jgi:hypothetical protein
VWDLRSRREVANVAVHTSPAGSGAVGLIDSTCAAVDCSAIVTVGADRAVALLDPRAGFELAHTFNEHRCGLRRRPVAYTCTHTALRCTHTAALHTHAHNHTHFHTHTHARAHTTTHMHTHAHNHTQRCIAHTALHCTHTHTTTHTPALRLVRSNVRQPQLLIVGVMLLLLLLVLVVVLLVWAAIVDCTLTCLLLSGV